MIGVWLLVGTSRMHKMYGLSLARHEYDSLCMCIGGSNLGLLSKGVCYRPNITQPNTLNSGAEFDAAPMRLRGGSDANSSGSIFLALPVLAP